MSIERDILKSIDFYKNTLKGEVKSSYKGAFVSCLRTTFVCIK